MIWENKTKKIWLAILLSAFYFFIFAMLLRNSFSYLDPDFGWHLKAGEQIWQTHAVPDINNEDYTLLGTHWVDHEWLANLFIYLIYHHFGYVVLNILFALLIIAALVIQLQFTRKFFLENDRGLIFSLLLQAFGLYAALPHLGVRVQEISIFLLLVLGIIIYLYNKNKNFRILFWLIPVFIFWASVHAGFLIGLFILGLFVLVKAAELFITRKFSWQFLDYGKLLNCKQIGVFAGFSWLALAATSITPYGWRLYAFLLGYSGAFYQLHISEWQGQYFFPFVYPQLIYIEIILIFLVLVFFSALIFKGERRQKTGLYDLVLAILFTGLAIKARRHFPLLFIVSLPFAAKFFIDFFLLNLAVVKTDRTLSDGRAAGALKKAGWFLRFGSLLAKFYQNKKLAIKKWFIIVLSLALFVSGAIMASKISFTNHPESAYAGDYPYQAVDFLRAHPEWNDLKIFNNYGWGGFLIWQYPERKLFIDGRLPQYSLRGRTALEEYEDFFNPDKMQVQLKFYDIGMVLISPKEQYLKVDWLEKGFFSVNEKLISNDVKKSFALLEYLKSSPDWRSVYNDGTAEIFVINK